MSIDEKIVVQKTLVPESDSVEEDLQPLEWNDKDEMRIRRRMDWRIIPTVLALYLLCFIDRANIGNARIEGMATDLVLKGYRFNWALTMFYISYIAVEIPSNIALKSVGSRFWLPCLVVAFGIVSMCTSFVSSYKGLLVCRFFLGLTEGGLLPGVSYYLSCFYRRFELQFRMCIFFMGSSLAGAFGGLLAAGLSEVPKWGIHARPINTWRNIFFFEGLLTIILSSLAILVLPSTPDQSKFLTPRDRDIALARINHEHKETAVEKIQAHHVRSAIFNINNLICATGFFAMNISVQSLSLFLPTILSSLNWTALQTQFHTVPPYTVACFWSVFVAWLSDRYRQRGVFLLVGNLLALIGYIMLVTVKSNGIKYLAVFFAASGAFPGGPAFLTWGLNNAGGTSIRAVSGAYIVALGSGGAIVATWTYLEKDKPNYLRGHYINIGAQCVAASMAALGIAYTKWENAKRAKGERNDRLEGLSDEEKATLGYRHPDFRYTS